jgi:predicted oxidoreductase
MELGCNWFDHADIYGNGTSHRTFAKAAKELGIRREDMFLQSKCGIVRGMGYDSSYRHIISAAEQILAELDTDYLDMLLLHRPDLLLEPEEVAEAFSRLEESGKVRAFGVSNYRTMTLKLLQKYLKQPVQANQLQFSLAHAGMLRAQAQSNTLDAGAADMDGEILDYCRLEDITVQAWSPFQYGMFKGTFLDSPEYPELNSVLDELALKYEADKTAIASAWIMRHPAGMQVIAGTTKPERLVSVCRGTELDLSREDWYRLYKSAGNHLP